MLEKYLEDIGLSDKEAKVYLSLLTRDASSVLEIAKDTGINRTTVYPLLERLIAIGLASEVKEGKKAHYEAAPPERLETYIEKRKADLNEKQNLLSEVIPQLRSVSRKSGEQPIVKFFEGREGIIHSPQDFYFGKSENDLVYMVFSKDLVDSFFSEKEKIASREQRLKNKVRSKAVIHSKNPALVANPEKDEVITHDHTYKFPAQINVLNDQVRIYTMGTDFSAIQIKSKDVADTLRTLITIAYEYLKEKSQK